MDPRLQAVTTAAVMAPHDRLWELSPAVARQNYRLVMRDALPAHAFVAVGMVENTAVPGATGLIPARVYRPRTTGPHPTVVFYHGGGFVMGDLETHDRTCRLICRDSDVVVVALDYRLAPEHPFPAGLDDAVTATRWIVQHSARFGGSDRFGVAGDSAGGNFAAYVAQVLAHEKPGLLDAQLLIYPVLDVYSDYPSKRENAHGFLLDANLLAWFYGNYTNGAAEVAADDVRISPLFAMDLSGVAPAVVVTAELDPLRDEGRAYAARLAEEGVPTDLIEGRGMIHGFFALGYLSPQARAYERAATGAFRTLLARTRAGQSLHA